MTAVKTLTTFNLPYNQSSLYWLAVFPTTSDAGLDKALTLQGMKPLDAARSIYVLRIEPPWDAAWKGVRNSLLEFDTTGTAEVSVLSGDVQPGPQEFNLTRKPIATIDKIANSLWLGKAMIEDRVVCYMQPVLDKRGKVFGYEAFARVETGGAPVGGGKIIEASRHLSAEYALDRHLHVKAITSFISSDLDGFLFINFVPGFIHRPEKYLEGLTESAQAQGMSARQIVLDFTQSASPQDLNQLKAIFEYCRTKGYSLSLDDIASVAMAKKLFDTIRPDFIKLDVELVREVKGRTEAAIIRELVAIAHGSGATVLAEGVETQPVHAELLEAGVDLFQGYLFSPPVAVNALRKAAG